MDESDEESTESSKFNIPSSVDIVELATTAVNEVLNEAETLVNSDPRGYFLYEYPTETYKPLFVDKRLMQKPEKKNSSEDNAVPYEIPWLLISNFTLNDAVAKIGIYVSRWHLSPLTKYVLIAKEKNELVPNLGRRFFIDVLFTKPTPVCPNPLAVATVYFQVHLSARLPKHYPVMFTYQFIDHKTVYHVFGNKCIPSFTFQHTYIDSIINMRIKYYNEYFFAHYPPPTPPETEESSEPEAYEYTQAEHGKFRKSQSTELSGIETDDTPRSLELAGSDHPQSEDVDYPSITDFLTSEGEGDDDVEGEDIPLTADGEYSSYSSEV